MAQKPKIEKPDYKKIESVISDKNSKWFYPKLFDRYDKYDTTLTNEEFVFLYYGFLYQDAFSPYGLSDYSDSLRRMLNKETLTSYDYDTIIRYEKLVLKKFPFNLRDLNILAYAYKQKDEFDSVNFIVYRLDNLINTILSTGNGEKEKTAWHVISISHEYDILNVLGYKFDGEQSLTTKGCDYLKVQENKLDIKGFYFDVNKLLQAELKLFKK